MDNYLLLVKRAKKGDATAFAKLYEDIYESLYRFALYTLRNTQDAEDAVSEAVTEAFASVKKLRVEEAFKGWIFKILSNKCKNRIREYRKKTEELNDNIADEFQDGSILDAVLVRKTFFELSDEERLIIGMHIFGGYKSKEIAEFLHMNENTVRSKESRGLKKMAGKLKSQEVKEC